jgi:glucokinase
MNPGEQTVVSVMDVGGTHVSAANVDLGTRSILPGQSARLPLDSQAGIAEFVGTLAACAARLPTRPGRRWSIALPGPFDYERGIAQYAGVGKFDALQGFDLRGALATRIPDAGAIGFHNDADAFGLGEWWVGAARGRRRVAGITLGTGVGSAFVEDGRVLREGPGIPADARIDQLLYEGRPLEETVSRRALIRAYLETSGAATSPDVKEIAERARQGERAAAAVFEQTYRTLGTVLAPILAAFEPEMLVVGGSIAASWDLIAEPLLAGLHEADPGGFARIAVEPALHPAVAALLGAAYLAELESR